MKPFPAFVQEDNLSIAWLKVFNLIIERGVDEITPLIVQVTSFKSGVAAEDMTIRNILNDSLLTEGCEPIEAVASTIFPQSLWNPNRDSAQLFERYLRIWEDIGKCKGNHRGVYFHRLISHGPSQPGVNQLKHIIDTWEKGTRRRTAFQASVFDPALDHTHARRLNFPCLQHVVFSQEDDKGLTVTGFYATQYIFDKAYGNYLGLCRLGHFVAKEMGLGLRKMTCITNIAKRGELSKGALRDLAARFGSKLNVVSN